eukprot:1465853-Amphidinium_carterae.3
MILSAMISRDSSRTPLSRRQLLVLDVSMARFHFECKRKWYIQLPEEDDTLGMVGSCASLCMALGTQQHHGRTTTKPHSRNRQGRTLATCLYRGPFWPQVPSKSCCLTYVCRDVCASMPTDWT